MILLDGGCGRTHAALSGIVLVGGHSRRMGCNKADLVLGGKTLIEWQIDKLQSLGIKDIMLSGSGSRNIPNTRTIPDVFPERGPLGGILACLRVARNDRCLVLCVDMPLIPVSTLSSLCQSHTAGVTVLRYNGRQEPLIGVYDRWTTNTIHVLIAERGVPVQALKGKVPWRTFDVAGPEEFIVNCNTTQDFLACAKYVSTRNMS